MTSYVRVLYEFDGESGSTEMSIAVNEVLMVTRTDVGEGWWEGRNSQGKIGLFPAAYVDVMSAAEVKQYQQQQQESQQQQQQYNQQVHSPPIAAQLSTGVDSNLTSGNRYDRAVDDYNDGDDWEDDWDDDNDTYSEIEPTNIPVKTTSSVGQQMANSTNFSTINRYPSFGCDDLTSMSSSMTGAMVPAGANNNNNAHTVKKSSIMFGKGYESFIMGNGKRDNIPENEIVHIIPMDNGFYRWKPNLQPYSVIVASPKKEKKFKGMKTYIAYQLTPSFNNISVSRRYKHFDWLHLRLVEKFCLIPIPPLPDKQISGRYEMQFVEHRRVQLQEFVDWVCRHPVLSRCEVWLHFLTCTDEKAWKPGKRKAERDPSVGVSYFWLISPPEKQLLQSYVDNQMDCCSQLIHAMDSAIRNLLTICNDMSKRYLTQSKKEYQRIGEGLTELSRALAIDERRTAVTAAPPINLQPITTLSESVAKISDIFTIIGQQFGEQSKFDWVPFSDRLHIYRGILSAFPDILSGHKGSVQKRKECERLTSEQKMSNSFLAEANRRVDIVSYAVIAEITHFREERETHLKQTIKSLIEEQIKFYSSIVSRLQLAYKQFE